MVKASLESVTLSPGAESILEMLYGAYFNIFNLEKTPVSTRLIIEGTGICSEEAEGFLTELISKRLIERKKKGERNFFRITGEGIKIINDKRRPG